MKRTRFDRGQFINKFDKWLGDCSRDRIKENISNDVISEFRAKKIDNKKKKTDIREIIDEILLVDDREIKQEIITAVRKRVM